MITIFTHGCATCGANSIYTAKVRSKYPSAIVVNTRATRGRLLEHIEYQKQAGLGSTPIPIVVEDNGRSVTVLSEWKP